VRRCRICPRVEPPPVAWRPEVAPRMVLVGQAPGPREPVRGRPFAFTAGARLFSWFARLGVPEEEFRRRVYIAAVLRCFPGRAPAGGDRVPARDEIANCGPYLERELALIRPATVIAVGQLAIARFLPAPAPLSDRIGRAFAVHLGQAGQLAKADHRNGEPDELTFEVVPLPHPSGRSTWLVRPENQARLDQALAALAVTRGWRETFPKAGSEAP
jgi:uracil-DNA glycosylase